MSATSSNSVTISGPSHVLDHLIRSGSFKRCRPLRLPIYGPYHAPHLHNDASVATILESLPQDTDSLPAPLISIISNDNEELHNASNFLELLRGILSEILRRPLDWEKLCKICAADVQDAGPDQCDVIPIGINNAGNSLVSALKQNGKFDVVLDDLHSNEPTNSHGAPSSVSLNADLENVLLHPWCRTPFD